MSGELRDTLLALEEGFWRAAGDGEFYRRHVADDGLFVLPAGAGVMPKEVVIAAVSVAPPWSGVEIDNAQLVQLTADSAALVYHARGARGADQYVALISSVYVRRDGEWLLALHQQTPV